MRLVQVLIPEGTQETALESLDSEGVDYAVFEEVGRGDFEAQVSEEERPDPPREWPASVAPSRTAFA